MELTPEQGYQISGEWMNKRTGEKIVVRDCIISGENMVIITNKGQINVNEFSNEYIQMSEEMYDQSGNVLSEEKKAEIEKKNEENAPKIEFNQEFPKELLEKAKNNTQKIEHKSKIHVEVPTKEKKNQRLTEKRLPKEELIKPIFDKIELNPQITFSIDCENFPATQFNMLKEFFDVSEKDIANYIIHYIITDEDFVGAVENFVKSKLN